MCSRFLMFLKLSKQKNTVSTDVFCASEDQNHGIYDLRCFFCLTVCTLFWVPVPSRNTGIYAYVRSSNHVARCSFNVPKGQKHCILRCFCFPAQQKIVKKLFKNGPKSNSKSILPVVPHKAVAGSFKIGNL